MISTRQISKACSTAKGGLPRAIDHAKLHEHGGLEKRATRDGNKFPVPEARPLLASPKRPLGKKKFGPATDAGADDRGLVDPQSPPLAQAHQ
jgi:hypothetical protein